MGEKPLEQSFVEQIEILIDCGDLEICDPVYVVEEDEFDVLRIALTVFFQDLEHVKPERRVADDNRVGRVGEYLFAQFFERL